MAYCRFSSNNWQCDVYVYESVFGGWTIHVAGRRKLIPPIPDLNILAFKGTWWLRLWSLWHRLAMWSFEIIPWKKIGLHYDGQTFNYSSPGEAASFLEHLKAQKYVVPQYAIDALREEQTELDAASEQSEQE